MTLSWKRFHHRSLAAACRACSWPHVNRVRHFGLSFRSQSERDAGPSVIEGLFLTRSSQSLPSRADIQWTRLIGDGGEQRESGEQPLTLDYRITSSARNSGD